MNQKIYVPKFIQAEMDEIDEATKLETTALEVEAGLWRIALSTKRVAFTIDFRHKGGGRFDWAHSTLAVDGQPRPLAKDVHHLASIFHDPDQRAHFQAMPPACSPKGAPALVQHTYHMLRNRFKDGASVRLGRTSRHWIVEFMTDRATLRMNFVHQKKSCILDGETPLQVSVDGIDKTAEVDGNLEEALSLIFETAPQSTPLNGSINAVANPARSNSVEVRRAVVMRN
jgi:hypothetical protein